MNTMATFWDSPIPSQRIDRGIQVIEGSGLNREMKGSTMARAGHQTPIKIPSGTATTAAKPKPRKTRWDEWRIAERRSPFANSRCAWLATENGDGRKTGETHRSSVASPQTIRKPSTENNLMIRTHGTRKRVLWDDAVASGAAIPIGSLGVTIAIRCPDAYCTRKIKLTRCG